MKKTKTFLACTFAITSFILLIMITVGSIILDDHHEKGLVKRFVFYLDSDIEKPVSTVSLDLSSEQTSTTSTETVSQTPRIMDENDISCYNTTSEIDGLLELESSEGEGPELGRSIFFLETSCFGDDGLHLNARQACAVESAARMNPNMTIYLLFLSPSKISSSSNLIIQQLLRYNNVKIRRINMDKYVKNTPLEKWYATGVLNTSNYPRIHMSDILRLLTLWKFGGIYMDLDVVVMKSLEDLENFSGAQDEISIANGVMGFGRGNVGRKFADACLEDLKENFMGWAWDHNGPGVITRVLQKLCGVESISEMTPFRCNGFLVFEPSVFYPIFYPSWRKYFVLDEKNETMEAIGKSKVIHLWNKLSKSEIVQVGSEVPYAEIAGRFCPKVYNNCGTTF